VDISEVDGVVNTANTDTDIDLEQFGVTVEAVEQYGGIAGAIAASMLNWVRKPADLYRRQGLHLQPDPTYRGLLPSGSGSLSHLCRGANERSAGGFGYIVDSMICGPMLDTAGGVISSTRQ
jgi:hypothetical protein